MGVLATCPKGVPGHTASSRDALYVRLRCIVLPADVTSARERLGAPVYEVGPVMLLRVEAARV
jgi:hypothetical protein